MASFIGILWSPITDSAQVSVKITLNISVTTRKPSTALRNTVGLWSLSGYPAQPTDPEAFKTSAQTYLLFLRSS